jgi:hypothetical protein
MALTFYPTDGALGVILPGEATTTALFATGESHPATLNSEWVYVQASSNVAANDAVALTTASGVLQAAPLTKALADDGAPVAISPNAITTNSYAWVARRFASGVSVNVLQTCSADVALYTSGSAGKLDDDSSGTTLIQGIRITANNATTATAAVAGISNQSMGA